MTPRDNDDARNDQPVDRPEGFSTEDEAAEPTVTRLSRADVRRYEQSVARSSSERHPQAAQPAPDADAGAWHEVPGAAGTDGRSSAAEEQEAAPASEPESEMTPARRPGEGDRGTTRTGRARASVAGAQDDQPTRPLQRPGGAEEAPTVVSRGPLVGEVHGSSPAGSQDRSTRVMSAPEGREGTGTRPGSGAAAGGAAAAAAAAGAAAAGRSERAAEEDREAELRAERRAEREARDRALGKRRPQPVPPTPVEPPSTKLPRTTDRFPASLGLFLLRLAVAAVVGIRGAQQLMDIPGTIQTFAGTALPYPEIFAWATAVASVLIAVALVLGLAVRVAGAGTALIGIGALAFVYWWRSPFESGLAGFRGESELLLAVLGVFLLLVGGGAWGIDGAIRKGRLQRQAEKFEAEQI